MRSRTVRRINWGGTCRRQMQPDLGFQLDHTGRHLDQPKAQGVELLDAPGRALWHGGAQSPEQPVSASMQEQAGLIGGGLAAGRAVGGEMGLPGFDVIFRATAPAINLLVERLRPAACEIGDNEPGVGSFFARFDTRNDAFDAAPTRGFGEEGHAVRVAWRGGG